MSIKYTHLLYSNLIGRNVTTMVQDNIDATIRHLDYPDWAKENLYSVQSSITTALHMRSMVTVGGVLGYGAWTAASAATSMKDQDGNQFK